LILKYKNKKYDYDEMIVETNKNNFISFGQKIISYILMQLKMIQLYPFIMESQHIS